jgi:hypothetical protein
MLKNKNTLLGIVALSILSNLFKTAYVFKSVSFQEGGNSLVQWAYALGSMVVIELSVLVLLTRGKKGFSYLFAFCTFLINWYYFNGFTVTIFKQNIVELIFAFLLPLSVVYFSELYTDENRIETEGNRMESVENGKLAEQIRILTEQSNVLAEVDRKWKLATTCECGFIAQSPNGLIAHKRSCILNK